MPASSIFLVIWTREKSISCHHTRQHMCNFSIKCRRLVHQGTEKSPAGTHVVNKRKKVFPLFNPNEKIFVAFYIFCRICNLSMFSQCDISSFRKEYYQFIGFFILHHFNCKLAGRDCQTLADFFSPHPIWTLLNNLCCGNFFPGS